jgi:hypothetical protein
MSFWKSLLRASFSNLDSFSIPNSGYNLSDSECLTIAAVCAAFFSYSLCFASNGLYGFTSTDGFTSLLA